jgi:threonine aldolase
MMPCNTNRRLRCLITATGRPTNCFWMPRCTDNHNRSRRVSSSFLRRCLTNSSSSRSSKIIDLRSDTVTLPSRAMLEAACHAPLGDDVMGEDVTVRELEAYMADWTGKPLALYLPTGTMANLVAIMAHCHERASEIIIGTNSHINLWEGGNVAGLGGVHSRQVSEDEITAQFNSRDVRDVWRSDNDDHFAKTQVLCLENTQNMMGGVALSLAYMTDMGALTRELGIRLHVDGARICNAVVAQQPNVTLADLCQAADSVSICLSKGLGAPVGSVLVGADEEFMRLAKRARKRCGGGMRQAGVIAAMGLYAVQNNVERLVVDHARAQRLASELERYGFRLARQGKVDTNIIYFRLPEDCGRVVMDEYSKRLQASYGVKLTGNYGKSGELFRAVTHMDLDDDDIDRAALALIDALHCRDNKSGSTRAF